MRLKILVPICLFYNRSPKEWQTQYLSSKNLPGRYLLKRLLSVGNYRLYQTDYWLKHSPLYWVSHKHQPFVPQNLQQLQSIKPKKYGEKSVICFCYILKMILSIPFPWKTRKFSLYTVLYYLCPKMSVVYAFRFFVSHTFRFRYVFFNIKYLRQYF